MKKPWFGQKRYGYGLVPISWEGWALTCTLIILIIASAYSNNLMYENLTTSQDIVRYLLDIVIFTLIFLLFSKDRMKGELKWRWGKRKNNDEDQIRWIV